MVIYTDQEQDGNLIDNSAKKERLFCKVNTERSTVDWSGNENIDVDFRCSVFFSAKKSKKQIYEIMNKIKANPITFLK